MGFFQIAFGFLLKILAYKKGASALLSFVVSISLSATLSNCAALFMEGADKKVMIMPLSIEMIMFIIKMRINRLIRLKTFFEIQLRAIHQAAAITTLTKYNTRREDTTRARC